MERVSADDRLKQLLAHASQGGYALKEDDLRVTVQRRVRDKAAADLKRLQEMVQARTEIWRSASAALSNVELWLGGGRPHGTELIVVETEPPKLGKGENGLLDAVANRRRRAQELRDELDRVENAPYPAAHCKAKIRQRVAQLAERGKPDVMPLMLFDQDVTWPKENVKSQVYIEQRALAFSEQVDPVAFAAWFDPARLIAKLDGEIDAVCNDRIALTAETRQLKAAALQADLLLIERDESALTWAAMDERQPVEFRGDIAPQAILGLALRTVPIVDGRSGTDVEHGFDVLCFDRREAIGPVMAALGEAANARAIPLHHEPVAVVLDFVNP
jgi:hypothetical protein